MHGLGNDFVILDQRRAVFPDHRDFYRYVANRRYGIGCDQVLVLDGAAGQAAAAYRVINADGSAAEQCGNGVRCLASLLQRNGEIGFDEARLEGPAGPVTVQCLDDGQVTVDMGNPQFDPVQVPTALSFADGRCRLPLDDETLELGAVSLGNPHAVIADQGWSEQRFRELGRQVSEHAGFPDGCNAGFVTLHSTRHLSLRVYERGVGPTEACGSGACAAFSVYRLWGLVDARATVDQPGGQLVIEWAEPNSALWMTGPASYVFKGQMDYDGS